MLTIDKLIELKKILNINYLAKSAGLNPATLRSKILNNRELTVKEANQIESFLHTFGIELKNINA